MKDLKEKTIRGGAARMMAQAANFGVNLASVVIMARLLTPQDFGLVGMVTAFTGVLALFRDFGLSAATVQREQVTEEQLSTLFWINVLVGAVLSIIIMAVAPEIVSIYHEPRLRPITMVLSAGFLVNALGIQHSALLQRQLRFTALAVINVSSLIISTITGMILAKLGFGYWALVVMTLAGPFATTVGLWIATAWVPGMPRRRSGIRSMMRFGGTLTVNGLVVYIAYNMEKILLGRYWGVEAIGLYGRAYRLINVPTDNLNNSVGEVAFSALSRVQNDRTRVRNYFLKGYSLVLAMTIPITLACAFFAEDMILVLLGPQWSAAAPIFRFLSPTILIFAMINPLGWLMFALGMVERSLKIGLVLAPIVIVGYLAGLRFGPKGVALGYSIMMILWVIPHIAWCVHNTGISVWDVLTTVSRPLLSGFIAGTVALGVHRLCVPVLSAFPRLLVTGFVLMIIYFVMLFYATGQKELYIDLIRGFRRNRTVGEEKVLVRA